MFIDKIENQINLNELKKEKDIKLCSNDLNINTLVQENLENKIESNQENQIININEDIKNLAITKQDNNEKEKQDDLVNIDITSDQLSNLAEVLNKNIDNNINTMINKDINTITASVKDINLDTNICFIDQINNCLSTANNNPVKSINKEIDEEINPLTQSVPIQKNKPNDVHRCNSVSLIGNIMTNNKEIDEGLTINEMNFTTLNRKMEKNYSNNKLFQDHPQNIIIKKQKLDFMDDLTSKINVYNEEKFDFLQLLDHKDLSIENLNHNLIKHNISSDSNNNCINLVSSSDIFDKVNDDSFFKEKIKHNNNNANLFKKEYEDPFSKKLNLKNNATTRNENHTENKINDMMTSLFPENSSRYNKKQTATIDKSFNKIGNNINNNNNSNNIFEKNKFLNNYEKLRYMLKENKMKNNNNKI